MFKNKKKYQENKWALIFTGTVLFAIVTAELAVIITNRMQVSNTSRAIDLCWGILVATFFFYLGNKAKKAGQNDWATLNMFFMFLALGITVFVILMSYAFQNVLEGLSF